MKEKEKMQEETGKRKVTNLAAAEYLIRKAIKEEKFNIEYFNKKIEESYKSPYVYKNIEYSILDISYPKDTNQSTIALAPWIVHACRGWIMELLLESIRGKDFERPYEGGTLPTKFFYPSPIMYLYVKGAKDIGFSITVLNHFEDKHKWPRTRRISLPTKMPLKEEIIIASSRWKKSIPLLSSFLLLLRQCACFESLQGETVIDYLRRITGWSEYGYFTHTNDDRASLAGLVRKNILDELMKNNKILLGDMYTKFISDNINCNDFHDTGIGEFANHVHNVLSLPAEMKESTLNSYLLAKNLDECEKRATIRQRLHAPMVARLIRKMERKNKKTNGNNA